MKSPLNALNKSLNRPFDLNAGASTDSSRLSAVRRGKAIPMRQYSMSALGHEPPKGHVRVESVHPSIADMRRGDASRDLAQAIAAEAIRIGGVRQRQPGGLGGAPAFAAEAAIKSRAAARANHAPRSRLIVGGPNCRCDNIRNSARHCRRDVARNSPRWRISAI